LRPTINTEKHMFQVPINTTAAAGKTAITLIKAVQGPTAAQEIRVGAVVKAVFIELWGASVDTTIGSVTITVEKLSSNMVDPTFAEMATLNAYANKKNILFTSQGLTPEFGTNPVAWIRQWIKIPKGKQRFGLDDRLKIQISANLQGFTHCGLAIFKEQY